MKKIDKYILKYQTRFDELEKEYKQAVEEKNTKKIDYVINHSSKCEEILNILKDIKSEVL